MHETVDVAKVREAPMMDTADWNVGIELFKKLMPREPFPEGRPSLAHVTALSEILRCGSCYVDFALWGNYRIRTAKTFRCRELIMGPGGVLIKGPPDFEHWISCWEVYQCGKISANVCIPAVFIAYALVIKELNKAYDEWCLPLMYQQDVRFRHEAMPVRR